MAIDSYMAFAPYGTNNALAPAIGAESQVSFQNNSNDDLAQAPLKLTEGSIFEIEDWNFDIEQTLNIGSQGGGSGAGKITFNPFSITRKIDLLSPRFLEMACSGTPFALVSLCLRKSSGTAGTDAEKTSGMVYLRFDFKLVAVKTVSWSHDDESPKEEVTFEYGGLQVRYRPQKSSGDFAPPIPGGWNRVRNIKDHGFGQGDIIKSN